MVSHTHTHIHIYIHISVTNTKCRIDTVISPDDGHIVARNMQSKEMNILRKVFHKVGFVYKII